MARVKGGMNAKKKHNRVLKLAKGYRGARSKQYKIAKQSVMRALTSAYAGRKQKKRQFRQLWIARNTGRTCKEQACIIIVKNHRRNRKSPVLPGIFLTGEYEIQNR